MKKISSKSAGKGDKAVLVIHGGAGAIANMPPALTRRYEDKLKEALLAGYAKLERGKPALDAVEAAIKVMEDSPIFNAGRGAVFTIDGRIELDSAIMDGRDRSAGAVTCINTVKNPIMAARAVMERSPHVMMNGKGAMRFLKEVAEDAGLKLVDEEYFKTKWRFEQLQAILKKEKKAKKELKRAGKAAAPEKKYGTVGAVAVDSKGNIAAGTSTGGTNGKKYGRTGDSPIIGAGTYADNETCAVSATGHGEYFIRQVAAHEVASLMRYAKMPVGKAADLVVNDMLKKAGGEGGLIAIDARGNFAMPFNSPRMFRGYITADGVTHVAINRD